MQATELTPDQIQHLFIFTTKHCVRHYDLQVELVDHLADAVAAKMNETETPISFDDALQKVYAGFGVMGFSPIITSRQQAVLKYSNREKWRLFKQYFTWPKAALTMLLVTVFATLPQTMTIFWLKVVLVTCSASFLAWEITAIVKVYKAYRLQTQKLLLTENSYWAPGFGVLVIDIFSMFHGWDWFDTGAAFSLNTFYTYSGICILFFICSLALVGFTKKLHLLARQQYPAAFKMAG